MIQSIFIISGSSGEVLIEKHWRGVTSRSCVDIFWEEVRKEANYNDVRPVIITAKHYLVNVHRSGFFFLL